MAITVILAAVIGTFVLGLGNQVGNNAPQVSFSTDFTNDPASGGDTVRFAYNGGGAVKAGQLTFKSDTAFQSDDGSLTGLTSATWDQLTSAGATSDVTAGDSATLEADGTQFDSATIRLTWTSGGGDSSAELAKWSGPDA